VTYGYFLHSTHMFRSFIHGVKNAVVTALSGVKVVGQRLTSCVPRATCGPRRFLKRPVKPSVTHNINARNIY